LNFNSYEYVLFFASVLAAFWLVPRRVKVPLLLVSSYFFYATLDWRFVGLLLLSTTIDYTVALNMEKQKRARRRQLLLLVSIFTNLTILGFFKYFDFFYREVSSFLGTFGLDTPDVALQIVLPVGISFYTFQSMSYSIDVYRRTVKPTRNYAVFATYVAFFPQLLAGPIERAKKLIPQLSNPRVRISATEVREGIDLILLGLFKKVAVGDVVAGVVFDAYGTSAAFERGILRLDSPANWLSLLLASYALVIQVYCDFSGYSDIARGSAKLLGFDISRNFLRPLWATTYRELWQRWHVTLFAWFRDYVYIPLGGNRGGPIRTYINVIIVFSVSGVWHGARVTWLAWGFLIGAVVIAEMAGSAALERRKRKVVSVVGPIDGTAYSESEPQQAVADLGVGGGDRPPSFLRVALMRLYVWNVFSLTSVLIATTTFSEAWDIWSGIFTLQGGAYDMGAVLTVGYAVLAIYLCDRHQHTLDTIEDERLAGDRPDRDAAVSPEGFGLMSWPVRTGLLLSGIVIFSGNPVEPFFYFQF
jgi:D-alanyl-lipoteichoic acid acyltransferase DltB (MBOAT superfamily)